MMMKLKHSILLVDDSNEMRAVMYKWLSINFPDCTILEAGTGEICVTLVKAKRPIIVLTDLDLPGISGIEATRRIKAHDPEIHVVIFTLDDGQDCRNAAKNAGARAYVLKYQLDKLTSILNELLPSEMDEKEGITN